VVSVTAPAVVAIGIIGYLGIKSIVDWVASQFKDKNDEEDRQ
jgi:hypothetical protein